MRFRWARRKFVQNTDDLSKWVDRMGFSLRPELLAYVCTKLGSWDIDRFALAHNATSLHFNALFGCDTAEATGAFKQRWDVGVSFVLPYFSAIDKILDVVERDNAEAIVVVPE